jgi:hypothetical protein
LPLCFYNGTILIRYQNASRPLQGGFCVFKRLPQWKPLFFFEEDWHMQKHTFSFYVGVGSLLIAGLFGLIQPIAVRAAGQTTAKAYEVIQFGEHDTIVREISFDAASISGMDALNLTGLDVATKTSSFGPYVCSIEGVGDCSGSAPYYWAYYQWNNNTSAWESSMVGAGSSTVGDSAADGWAYLSFSFVGDPVLPSAQRVKAAPAAAAWLDTQQDTNTGGYGSTGGSVESLLAVGSDGYRASEWIQQAGSPSLGGYWMVNGTTYARKGGDSAGKLAVGLQSAGACWLATAPRPAASYNATSGLYANGAGPQAWAILGSLALGENVPAQAVTALTSTVQSDGGWEWQSGFGSDTNTTALVVQALLATGEVTNTQIIINALAYLKSAQQDDGGIAYNPTTNGSDADSSAYSIMAIQAAGEDPTAPGWTKNGKTPVSYLLDLQLPNGSFEWQKGLGANLLATSQAIPALLGNDYLLKGNQLTQCPAVYLPVINK